MAYYEDIEFYKEHPLIKLITDKGTENFIVFAYYLIDTADTEMPFVYWESEIWGSKATYNDYMAEVQARNWLNTNIPLDYESQYLTLSSCSVELAHSGTNRMVVMARRLEVGEEYDEYIKNASMNESPLMPEKLQ